MLESVGVVGPDRSASGRMRLLATERSGRHQRRGVAGLRGLRSSAAALVRPLRVVGHDGSSPGTVVDLHETLAMCRPGDVVLGRATTGAGLPGAGVQQFTGERNHAFVDDVQVTTHIGELCADRLLCRL